MRVIIRADGNQEIGMGHIMRCLSIADALQAKGAEAVFVTADRESLALLRGRGYEPFVLECSYREMESELDRFGRYFRQHPAELILVDSYCITRRYMETVGSWARTAWMDDLGEPVYPTDVLIDYNIYGKELPYETAYRQAGLRLPERSLLGCEYAPLRAQFAEGRHSRIRESVSDVLITTGGGDAANVAGELCRRLAAEIGQGRHRDVRYHVVCGPFSRQKEMLKQFAGENPAFRIHENVTDMRGLMEECDIAVSAAGSTMYELCSMRLPTVCFTFAENQLRMAACFDALTEIRYAGNVMEEREAVMGRLLEQIFRLEQDGALRERIRKQMEGLTDGRGAGRLARALLAEAGQGQSRGSEG